MNLIVVPIKFQILYFFRFHLGLSLFLFFSYLSTLASHVCKKKCSCYMLSTCFMIEISIALESAMVPWFPYILILKKEDVCNLLQFNYICLKSLELSSYLTMIGKVVSNTPFKIEIIQSEKDILR